MVAAGEFAEVLAEVGNLGRAGSGVADPADEGRRRASLMSSDRPAARAASTASSRVADAVPAVSVLPSLLSLPDANMKARTSTATTTSGAATFPQVGRDRTRPARPWSVGVLA